MSQLFRIRAKAIVFLIVFSSAFCFSSHEAAAQDFITTMTEQIAKLELYLQDAKKGYAIVQQGLTTIGDIKKGDFDLHSLFFGTLKNVNPAIKNWGKVADIIAMQGQILFVSASTLQQLALSGSFNKSDLGYVTAVYNNLKDLTGKDIVELTGLLTDGKWQMSDDERMTRIDQLFMRVSEKYTFLQSFSNRVSVEAKNRIQEKISIENFKRLQP